MTEKSIKEVSDLWRRDKKQYVKQSTYAAYILILENHILPAFGSCTTICEDDVQEPGRVFMLVIGVEDRGDLCVQMDRGNAENRKFGPRHSHNR